MGEESSKNFTDLPPHWSLSVRFDVIITNVYNWNNQEYLRILFDH